MRGDLRKPPSAGLGWPDASLRSTHMKPLKAPEHRSTVQTALGGGGLPAFDHRVQFYESDAFLFGVVSDFIGEGLGLGEPAVVIATPAHREGLLERLKVNGVDTNAFTSSGRLLFLDARASLGQFMVDGMPHPELFAQFADDVMARLRTSSADGHVRAYGEIVDLLWRDGAPDATLALEALWNSRGRDGTLSLLCGYCIDSFDLDDHGEPLVRVCDAHQSVVPAEAYPAEADSQERLREIIRLQQRARVLEREVEHRKRLEQVLQAALLQRHHVEDELRNSQQELKTLGEELRRQNADLQRTVRFSELFVGILGHDLRNPLSAIATAASLLRRRADSDKVAKPAARILNSAGRMGRMIDQLLDFTRIRLGEGIPVEQRQTDLVDVCRMAIDEVETIGATPAVELKGIGDSVGSWDADRLLQLVSNLLSNAVVHGKVAGSIVISIDGTEDDTLVLDIHNAGAVPQTMLPLLFEPFRSGSPHKQEGSHGLGLGLYISQQIAHAHAGRIDVSSSESEGTRFTVYLPRFALGPKPVFSGAGNAI